jgi:flagellar basal-body rod protein FlgF
MENVSYVGLSQQMALQREMEITANNIANMNTSGFKAQGVMFLEYLNKAQAGDQPLRQVMDYGVYRNLAPGTMKQTFNKLDVAVQGDGYFSVQTPAGVRYTRDGSFTLNSNKELVTQQGYQVLGDGGPIAIQADAHDITITDQGDISTEKGALGKLKVVTFANQQALKPVGNNLLDAGSEPESAIDIPKVSQGMVEASNVNPVVEMNKMITILRAYQSAQKMLMDDHQRQLGAIQKLTQA